MISSDQDEMERKREELFELLKKRQKAAVGLDNTSEYPLSDAQQRLWFIQKREAGSSQYNVPLAMRIRGKLREDGISFAIRGMLRKHPILTHRIYSVKGELWQKAVDEPPDFRVVDLQHLDLEEREAEAQRILTEICKEAFVLEESAPVRFVLLILDSEQSLFSIVLHHIITDGWSNVILLRDLEELYNSYCSDIAGANLPEPASTDHYKNHVLSEVKNSKSGDVLNGIRYWKNQLESAPHYLPMPSDFSRPYLNKFDGGEIKGHLSKELQDQITAICKECGCTSYTFFLAVFNIFLLKYTGQRDIVIGTPVVNRLEANEEKVVGLFANTLPVRTVVDADETFDELLKAVSVTVKELLIHQSIPFGKIIESVNPPRNPSLHPLFQVMYVWGFVSEVTVHLTECEVSIYPIQMDTAKYDLTLAVSETANGIDLVFEYNSWLFAAQTVQNMVCHFCTLVEHIIREQQTPIGCLNIMTPSEISHNFRKDSENRMEQRPVYQLFECCVEQYPEHTAVVDHADSVTYAELNLRANRLAHRLLAQGVGPGDCIGLHIERSIEYVTSVLGILKAGAAFVPLDPEYPLQRLYHIIEDTQMKKVIVSQDVALDLSEHDIELIYINGMAEDSQENNRANPSLQITGEDLAYVIYTSGSTGVPNGVMVKNSGLSNIISEGVREFGLKPGRRVTQFVSMNFDVSIFETLTALTAGASLYLLDNTVKTSIPKLAEYMNEHLITDANLPMLVLEHLVSHSIPSLANVYTGGEACSQLVAEHWSANRNFYNLYGPTETTIIAAWYKVRNFKMGSQQSVPIGTAVPNVSIFIIDPYGKLCPEGVTGEIFIGGAGVSNGYIHRTELNRQKFILYNVNETETIRLYTTGDLGRRNIEGNIEFIGRVDNQVKFRGYRIELGEIESTLKQMPWISDAVVLIKPDRFNILQLVAFIVPGDDREIDYALLKQDMANKLPEYMIPSFFDRMESVPLSPNNKIDKQNLLDRPMPEIHTEITTPKNEVEQELARIWGELFEVDPAEISCRAKFYDLGGHSLLVPLMLFKILEIYDCDLPLQTFLDNPTIEALASIIINLTE